jgi:hypothetical protein
MQTLDGAALRTAGFLFGLLPDSLIEGVRQSQRFTMPLPETPVDALQHLLVLYGLPTYAEGYFSTLDRLRNAWLTHEVAGAQVQLEAELVSRCGLTDATIIPDGLHAFSIETSDAAAYATWGSFNYGDGTIYGWQIDNDVAQNVLRCLRYFKPARILYTGLTEVT